MMRSASRASRIWPTSCSASRSHRSVKTVGPGQRLHRADRYEFLRRPRHAYTDIRAPFPQTADEIEAFVSRDAAADEEEDGAVGEGLAVLHGVVIADFWSEVTNS